MICICKYVRYKNSKDFFFSVARPTVHGIKGLNSEEISLTLSPLLSLHPHPHAQSIHTRIYLLFAGKIEIIPQPCTALYTLNQPQSNVPHYYKGYVPYVVSFWQLEG